MDLKFRKIHFDSRMKSSGTHSQFEYNLAEPFDTPEGTICYVDNVSIPHTWYSVDSWNQNMYVAEKVSNAHTVRLVTVPVASYSVNTLKSGLETALNTNRPANIGAYIVAHTPSTNKLAIACAANCLMHVLTDDEIKLYDQALLVINKGDPRPFNGVIRNREGFQGTSAQSYTYTDLFTSGSLDIIAHHNVYIHSSIASFNTLGPIGQSDIICKCPVNVNFGTIINHNVSSAQDFSYVGKRTLSNISFSIRDAYGHLIDLQGASWSLSLTFAVE